MVIMNKGAVDIVQLILLIAISSIVIVFLVKMVSGAIDNACKKAQVQELQRIWNQIFSWEKFKGLSPAGGYNYLYPSFQVKQCVEYIKFNKSELVLGTNATIIKWIGSHQTEEMYAGPNGTVWNNTSGGEAIMKTGTYDVKISYRFVEFTKVG
jgi:hypothetical protein